MEIDGKRMQLSWCWVALPAYSSLVLAVILSEFETGQTSVDDTVPMLAESSWMTGKSKNETIFVRELHLHRNNPLSSPAIEIFSVFVGREKSKAPQIHGSIEVVSGDERVCHVFKRDKNDALCWSEHMNVAPVLDGSRLFEYCHDLEMKVDLQDAAGSFAIKDYTKWDAELLDSPHYINKQLCSFFQGRNGFVAVHYSILSYAVAANLKIFLNLKTTSAADVYRKVYGNLISQYRYHYYLSRYHKDFYRSVLFMKTRDDSVQLHADGLVPLSRSSVVVPKYSTLIINVDLSTGISSQKLSRVVTIEIGDCSKPIETDDYILRIEVD